MNTASPQPGPAEVDNSTRGRREITPGRRRAGIIGIILVAIILPLVLWQTWGYWRGEEEPFYGSMAVDGARDGGGGAGGPGGGGGAPKGGPPAGFDPAAMRGRVQEQIRSAMGDVSDEAWAALRPKIEAVQVIQEQLRPRLGPPGGPGGGGGADGTEVGEKAAALGAALADEEGTPEAVAATLAATRAARAKAAGELEAAREALRKGLTPRQEAALITFGVLE